MTALLVTSAVLAVALLALVVAHRSPRLAVVVAIAALCLLPVWVGARLGFNGNLFLPAGVLVAVAVTIALLPARGFRPSPADAMLGLLVLLALVSFLTDDPALALAFLVTPFAYFVAGYALGRLAALRLGLPQVHRIIAVAFTVVAALAILEYLSGWNPFVLVQVDGSQFAEWGTIQERGGLARAEGAFGHSIALGASLALAIPLTIASSIRFPVRVGMVLLMLAATVVTFSRIGIISAAVGVVLTALFLREGLERRQRAVLVGGMVIVAVAALPLVSSVFSSAGDEAADSAGYRGDLLPLIAQANLVGFSDLVQRSPSGQLAFGPFRSIDSQFVLTALSSGLLALVIVALGLLVAIVLCIRRRATAATIALVAQIPALATVALITQYSIVLWLVVGIAATGQIAMRRSSTPAPAPPVVPAPPSLRGTPAHTLPSP